MDPPAPAPAPPGPTLARGALTALLRQLAGPDASAAPSEGALLGAGDVVARFEILRQLGQGGFGTVYEARDRALGRLVALKLLRAAPAAPGSEAQREAEAVAQLAHTNIVTLHDAGAWEGRPYLVLELLRGETLGERLRRGPLPLAQALGIAIEVARALDCAHASGVVHRDLKPANVHLGVRGEVKVLDFGLALLLGARWTGGGTPAYMAPEQWRGGLDCPATDVFSAAVMLWESFAGARPFAGSGPPGEPPPPPAMIPPALAQALTRALRPAIVDRTPSGSAWLEELREVEAALTRPEGPGPARGRAEPPPSVMVLRLHDLSERGDQQHVCEGLADEISSRLARIPGLAVIARPAGVAPEDGEALRAHVATVVEGSLRKAGHRLRISVRWIDLATRRQRWAGTFEGGDEELFELQDRIASAVADRLVTGAGGGSAQPTAVDLETYELYLRGRMLWSRRPGPVVWEALECLERATQRSPGFAPAWAGIADVYNTLGSWEAGVLPHEQALSKAMACAQRALELDPGLAEAHTALAYAALHYEWDLARAEGAFRRAIAIKPSYGNALHWYSHALAAAGRFEESWTSSRAALAVEPMSLLFHVHLAWHHHLAREPALTLEAAERVIRMDPAFHWGHFFASWGAEALGERERGCALMEEAVRRSGRNAVMLAGLARCRALVGDAQAALALVRDLEARGPQGLFAYEIALVHLGLGDRERALASLELAHASRSGWMAYARVDPRLDPLRGEARLAAVLPEGIPAG